jgi:hypothetical protein
MRVMQLRRRTWFAGFLACACLFFTELVFGAGNYSHDFTSDAGYWATTAGTWRVNNGYYENSASSDDAQLVRSISYYKGDAWATNYTFKASLNADYGANGANKIGVVFNYLDVNNYYEVLIDMLGNVTLTSVVNGTRSTVSSGAVSSTAVPGIDQWFDVTVTRSGTTVSVKVGSETALSSVPLPTLSAGRVGVFTNYNHGKFDNVSVTVNYSQDFSSNASGWMTTAGSWRVANGYYENSANEDDAPLFRSIAYYNGTTWTTDYTYKASLNADYGGNGSNKIGVVFNYVDTNNYYEVLIDMLGNVSLNSVVNNTRTTVKSGHVSSVPGIDQWFDVTVTRSGNTVAVKVGSESAIPSTTVPQLAAGRIGVFTNYNHGRFDNIQVTPAGLLTPVFKTGFGSGLTVTAPVKTGSQWRFSLVGTEAATGTTFPPDIWGAMTGYMMQPLLPDTETFDDKLSMLIKPVTGAGGSSTNVLSNTVKTLTQFTLANGKKNILRLGLNYAPDDFSTSNPAVPHQYYIRRYLKVGSNLLTPTDQGPVANHFLVMHEFKNTSCTYPRRLVNYWYTDQNKQLYFTWWMDYSNNCADRSNSDVPMKTDTNGNQVPDIFHKIVSQKCVPGQTGPTGNQCPQVPLGQWFYDEYFAQYSDHGASDASGDRVQYAINGQVIFDYHAPIDAGRPEGIKLAPGYLDINKDVEFQTDDVEVYADRPCGSFPCGAPNHY